MGHIMRRLTVLFDFDGTLVNQNMKAAYRAVAEGLGIKGATRLAEKLYQIDRKHCARGYYDRSDVFRRFDNEFAGKRAERLCHDLWKQVEASQTCLPNSKDTLRRLKHGGYPLVCVTDSDGPGGSKERRIKASGLSEYFDWIAIGDENIPVRKGSQQYLEEVLRHDHVSATDCVMIGDKVDIDLVPAKALGMRTIYVKNSTYAGPWPVEITDLSELIPIIKQFEVSYFVSYSHKDEEFAKKVSSRLRSENLRVWYASESMRGGDGIRDQIRQAIGACDKLLLILSKTSMRSPWVVTEICEARQRETREKRRILFPIRLVKYDAIKSWECFDHDTGKDLAREIREYFIPDFSGWQDDSAFEKSFSHLLRDLRQEPR
jgi:FMN phosphatase YigB (HAD superfamily)